ncbi:MAG: VanZ family protein [Marinicellaceae bacterium]
MVLTKKHLLLIGWLLIIAVVFLSLAPINNAIPNVQNGDKIGHFIAYFTLMTWFSWLYPKPLIRNIYAIGFILLGGLMELMQSMTAHRMGDIEDFHVNTIGVICGFVFSVLTANIPIIKKLFSHK